MSGELVIIMLSRLFVTPAMGQIVIVFLMVSYDCFTARSVGSLPRIICGDISQKGRYVWHYCWRWVKHKKQTCTRQFIDSQSSMMIIIFMINEVKTNYRISFQICISLLVMILSTLVDKIAPGMVGYPVVTQRFYLNNLNLFTQWNDSLISVAFLYFEPHSDGGCNEKWNLRDSHWYVIISNFS